MQHYLYLLLDILTLAGPMARSFEPRIAFYKRWKGLFLGIAVTGTVFIVWDVLFTKWGVWGFNDHYLCGVKLGNLPLEEYLFFIVVPYACVFIYAVLNYFIKRDLVGKAAVPIATVLGIGLIVAAAWFNDRAYTVTTFSLLGIFLLLHAWVLKSWWLGRFLLGYAVALIPFFIVNGILTGSFIDSPIVWYNNAENLGIRMGTIPFEDTFYGMLLVGGVTWIYERNY